MCTESIPIYPCSQCDEQTPCLRQTLATTKPNINSNKTNKIRIKVMQFTLEVIYLALQRLHVDWLWSVAQPFTAVHLRRVRLRTRFACQYLSYQTSLYLAAIHPYFSLIKYKTLQATLPLIVMLDSSSIRSMLIDLP